MTNFTDGDATRVLQAIEERVRRRMKNGAFIHTTWGTVAALDATEGSASVYLYDQLVDQDVASEGFILPPLIAIGVGDVVKVAIDYQRGERWIESVAGNFYDKAVEIDLDGSISVNGDGLFVWNNGDSVASISVGKTTGDLPGVFMGDGASAFDVNLFRPSAGVLKLTSSGTSGPGRLMIGDSDNGADLSTTELYIGIERPWQFIQGLSGASTELWLKPVVAGGKFNVVANDDTPILGVLATDAGAKSAIVFGDDTVLDWGSTAFPPSPATGDKYYRTDLNMWFFYNGTRWLSTTLFFHELGIGWSNLAATDFSGLELRTRAPSLRGGSDIWIEDWEITFNIVAGTALSASHKWTVALAFLTPTGAVTTRATQTIDSGSTSTWRTETVTVDALMNNGTTHWMSYSTATKTGTPGNMYSYGGYTYRVVAT